MCFFDVKTRSLEGVATVAYGLILENEFRRSEAAPAGTVHFARLPSLYLISYHETLRIPLMIRRIATS